MSIDWSTHVHDHSGRDGACITPACRTYPNECSCACDECNGGFIHARHHTPEERLALARPGEAVIPDGAPDPRWRFGLDAKRAFRRVRGGGHGTAQHPD